MELAKWRLKQLWMAPFVRTQAGSDALRVADRGRGGHAAGDEPQVVFLVR